MVEPLAQPKRPAKNKPNTEQPVPIATDEISMVLRFFEKEAAAFFLNLFNMLRNLSNYFFYVILS